MKRTVTASVVAACLMAGGLLAGGIDLTPGSAVSDSVAADLHGGCAGVGQVVCGGYIPCPQTCYLNGNQMDYDPGDIPVPQCFGWYDPDEDWQYCATAVLTYVSCASGTGPGTGTMGE
jgi:hypothetical protein